MFFNRDLSWLGFNYRVLEEASKTSVPLFERLKFLAIFSSNLDEFFRVRYPALRVFSQLDKKTIRKESLFNEEDLSDIVQNKLTDQLEEFGQILRDSIIPELEQNNIYFYYNRPILQQHQLEIKEIFLSQVLSFIQPIILDAESSRTFYPENNQLYLVITLKDKVHDTISHTIINIPSTKLKRFYVLSPVDDMQYVVFIDDIVRENINILFSGQKIESVYSIKFNRDAELNLTDVYSRNLLDKIEKLLSKRDMGETSRFLYEKGMPSNLQHFLATIYNVQVADMFEGGRYHNLSNLFSFPSFNNSLNYKKIKPLSFPLGKGNWDIFNVITQKDILLHLPYHSYVPVLAFFNQAAVDPAVTHIYITLYRVATESHIVNALISAARNGKNVTAFIELKARFDEANNIKWSRVMKKAGIRLIYSENKIKVHSKIAMVKKIIDQKPVCFAVLSTGNFNESTATFYTDHVLMTINKSFARELMRLFEFLQKKDASIEKQQIKFSDLWVSQFNMLYELEKQINNEIKKAEKKQPSLIRIKVNNLEEPGFIELLYKASNAGVHVQLIVRSICCLIPGADGQSSNIIVKRIVGRYLEHTRLFIFGQNENAVVAIGSSDLMTRNLYRRIEVLAQVKDESCKKELLDYFELQWADTFNVTMMLPNTEHVRNEQVSNTGINSQEAIYSYLENKL
ncbi:MAG: polyphosphate kinase 1 [Ferruginibacter sp.]